MNVSRRRSLVLLAALLAALLCASAWQFKPWRWRLAPAADLDRRLAQVLALPAATALPCQQIAPRGTPVLLVLGQSNAANHGALAATTPRIAMITSTGCALASDPLPGGTGRGGAIWSRLPAALRAQGVSQTPVISLLAVDATSITEWTAPGSALRARLDAQLAWLLQNDHPPTLVLWHQGEADALRRSTTDAYRQALSRLADLVQARVGPVPILLARTTVCRSAPSMAVQQAIDQALAQDRRFGPGPDLDMALTPAHRHDGCHLNTRGLDRAAELWAQAIRAAVPASPSPSLRASS